MTFDFRYPQITGATEKERSAQMQSYLHQLVDQLKWALNSTETAQNNNVVVQKSAADFVVEQSNIEDWHIRKWHSGYAECWLKRNIDVSVETLWGTNLYVGQVPGISYPFTFTAVPSCQITLERDSDSIPVFLATSGGGTTSNTPAIRVCRTDIQQVNVNILYYAHGKWR